MLKKVSTVSRYLLGLVFFLSGIVGLLNLVPPPADLPPALMEFMKGIMAAKYFFPLLKGTEMICGLLAGIQTTFRKEQSLDLTFVSLFFFTLFFRFRFFQSCSI